MWYYFHANYNDINYNTKFFFSMSSLNRYVRCNNIPMGLFHNSILLGDFLVRWEMYLRVGEKFGFNKAEQTHIILRLKTDRIIYLNLEHFFFILTWLIM